MLITTCERRSCDEHENQINCQSLDLSYFFNCLISLFAHVTWYYTLTQVLLYTVTPEKFVSACNENMETNKSWNDAFYSEIIL